MQSIVLHLDMNSYFASVEQQDYPEYRGKPLGVCEHLGGIIIAASVEAKRWGIKTGTPVWEAKKLYPKIILSHTHPNRYRFYHNLLVKVVSDYTDHVEPYSIDEVFLDITKACNIKKHIERQTRQGFSSPSVSANGRIPASPFQGVGSLGLNPKLPTETGYYQVNPFEEAVNIALEIKRRMKKEVADYMTCSIGIGENKLIAKIASDLKKPDGITVVTSSKCQVLSNVLHLTIPDLYNKLKLTDVPGIGHRQEKRLNKLGIKTLLDLKNCSLTRLIAHFGVVGGYHIKNMGELKGSFKPRVEREEKMKSMGHMYTLPKEFREPKFFVPVLYKLCEMVAKRLRKQNMEGNIINFYFYTELAGQEAQSFGQSLKLNFYTNDGREIFFQCFTIFKNLSPSQNVSAKLLGVTVSGLKPVAGQLSIFGQEERLKRINQSLDKINQKYGDFTVCRVPILSAKEAFHDSIGFGRLKEFSKFSRK